MLSIRKQCPNESYTKFGETTVCKLNIIEIATRRADFLCVSRKCYVVCQKNTQYAIYSQIST